MTTTRRLSLAYLALTAGLAVLFALNLFWGSVELTPGAVAAALLGRGGDALAVGIVLQLRLPRAVMVVLLGAALSAAGYLLQTFFANPIAGPFVLGISSGAKMTVCVAMLVLLATGWHLPAPVQQFCSAVGGCTTPLALMIVGVLLADSDIRALLHTGFLYRVTLLRGILFPLLFMLLLWLLPLDNVLRTGLSIIACCPAGSLAAVLARQTGTEATLASQAVAHSTVCMLVTVPAMLLLTGAIFPM